MDSCCVCRSSCISTNCCACVRAATILLDTKPDEGSIALRLKFSFQRRGQPRACNFSQAGRLLHAGQILASGQIGRLFIFIFFKMFFIEIYFWFHILQFYTPTVQRGGGRDLHVNKHNFFCAEASGGSLPPPCRAAGSPPARWRGGRLPQYKR